MCSLDRSYAKVCQSAPGQGSGHLLKVQRELGTVNTQSILLATRTSRVG